MRCGITLLLFILGCGSGGPKPEREKVYGEYEPLSTRITILHTNDWQSHMLGQGPNAEYSADTTDDDGTMGGLARVKTLVDEIRAASTHPVVLYDAGDWMAGALFQLLGTSHASELQMMQMLGYDAICLGNHEFDWGPEVLGQMIARADELGVTVPIVASNTVPNPDDPGDDALEAHFTSGRISDTLVQTLDNGIRVGLYGLVGDDAARITPGVSPAAFTEAEPAVAAAVEALEAQDVDIIIGISHAGVSSDPGASEDELIAEAVPGIDVIVSGHSHTALFEHRTVGTTTVVQAGAYTQYLGQLDLVQEGEEWVVENYQLHPIDDTIPGDPDAIDAISGFVDALNDGPLADLGVSFDEPVFEIPDDIVVEACAESGLGNFVTDAFRYTLSMYSPDDPIVAAFESQGVIRDNFLAGATGVEAFSDVFRVMPLGMGQDDVPGYGLVHFWVTPKDLKSTCEIVGSIMPMEGCDYMVEASGLRCHMDLEKSFGNTARGVDLWEDDSWVSLDVTDNETLYHVAVDSYVASLMNILGGLTFDAVVIQPKLADGTVVEDTSTLLFDKDPDTSGVQEVKLWEALMTYGETFEDLDSDGLPDIPERYTSAEGRMIFAE